MVKGQGHSVRNNQHRFTSNMSRFVTYLPRERVEHSPTTRTRIAQGGRIGSTWRLPGALRKTSENNIFKPNKPEKSQNVWCDVVRPSRCNAFAIARFLVLLSFLCISAIHCMFFSVYVGSLCKRSIISYWHYLTVRVTLHMYLLFCFELYNLCVCDKQTWSDLIRSETSSRLISSRRVAYVWQCEMDLIHTTLCPVCLHLATALTCSVARISDAVVNNCFRFLQCVRKKRYQHVFGNISDKTRVILTKFDTRFPE